MFKRMLSAFGVGGPSVDTVLDSPHAVPGEVITGQVRIQGGSSDAQIEEILLSLVTRVEVEHGDHERAGTAEFLRVSAGRKVRVTAGQLTTVPFQLALPWETPISAVGGRELPGMVVGVRTELVIAGAPDKGDLDPVLVGPLESQDRVLEAFGELGFSFRSADVEAGRLHGVRQELGFFQEIEFFPPSRYAGRVSQVELTFVASPDDLVVVLEADRRGGMFRSGGDSFGRFHVSHEEALRTDWAAAIDGWLAKVAESGGGHAMFGGHQEHYGHDYDHHGHHGRRGPGMGGVVAGAAAGVVGGMILGEVMEDVFDGGDEGFEE
ncbi:sporulation protein [Amycolatopsis keratiniphila]|uniref:Sporulation-control protein n=1 Tax=Amycolatopsis keratiniphila TaxID=129921 RepID=R4SZZ1_9PSEU|nr:sporulation protein [Amycolatopsis keratiniphila]AGM04008.1 sporulation-control protein [Amycolatopsis keratiniphila]OLZ50842.1 SpoOM family protein [Amycolatopsis keratiniphila subsp. nogabecina]SDU45514.1 sporulation-control protein [Amycolatopsis keratiniphila]